MELQTISQISRDYGISVRMLRYYEQIGLIKSLRKENYSYRVYDETAVRRLQQIIILRKLRISVRQIQDILENENAAAIIDIFNQNISELDEEITALSTVRTLLIRLVDELREKAKIQLRLDLLNDKNISSVIDSLSFSKNYISNIKENLSMEELNKANETLNKLTDKDVRIIYLPPAMVAAMLYIGDGSESNAGKQIDEFVLQHNLPTTKPDMRRYEFDYINPNKKSEHGYEVWVTIPDDMDVPEPLMKKKFEGGLYAAYMAGPMDWNPLLEWINNSQKYGQDLIGGGYDNERMGGLLIEILNYRNNVYEYENGFGKGTQFDLLCPIKQNLN